MTRLNLAMALALGLLLLVPAGRARAWDPLHTPNPDIAEGNARMAAGNPEGALEAYDEAARRLPDDPRVALNRGLALMAMGDLDAAGEALSRAGQDSSDDAIRAAAFYDLGLAHYRTGDELAGAEDHEQARERFQSAADALRASLRARPGNRDAAWNLELALRREQEQQEEQEREEHEQEDEEDSDDSEEQEDSDESEQQEDSDDEGAPEEDQEPSEDEGEPSEDESEQEQEQEQEPSEDESEPEPEAPPRGQELPEDARRLLDALQDDEESLERQRARARAARERRRPTRDW